jgi:hypothetical protein
MYDMNRKPRCQTHYDHRLPSDVSEVSNEKETMKP